MVKKDGAEEVDRAAGRREAMND